MQVTYAPDEPRLFLITGKTRRHPIWAPCWNQDGVGSGISCEYLWRNYNFLQWFLGSPTLSFLFLLCSHFIWHSRWHYELIDVIWTNQSGRERHLLNQQSLMMRIFNDDCELLRDVCSSDDICILRTGWLTAFIDFCFGWNWIWNDLTLIKGTSEWFHCILRI